MPVNTETKIPDLLSQYVDSRRVELGIPAAALLPFVLGVRDGTRAFPCVVFYCESFDMRHPERISLVVRADYINQTAISDSDDESTTAAKVRAALADVESWKAWLLDLDEADREGWRITKTRLIGGGIDIDAELGIRRRHTAVAISAITSETTFPD